jgi:hypothetical protein
MKLKKIWKIKTKTTFGEKKKGGKTYKIKKTFYHITCNYVRDNSLQAADGCDDAP